MGEGQRRGGRRAAVLLGLAAAFVLPRMALWLLARGAGYDLGSYALVAAVLRSGGALYRDPALAGRYPYPPAWAWMLGLLAPLWERGFLPLARAVKLPGLLAEAGILALMLAWRERDWSPPRRRRVAAAWAWALSPVAWLVTAGHGQFDAVVLFLVLAAGFGWGRPGGRAGARAGALLGAAICFKQWPLLLVPAFCRRAGDRRAGWALAAAALAVPLACLAPYALAEGPAAVFGRLAYVGIPFEGPGRLLALLALSAPGRTALVWWARGMLALLALAVALPRSSRGPGRPTLVQDLAASSLAILALAPAVSPQYFLWPLPFLALSAPRSAWLTNALAGGVLTAVYVWVFPRAIWAGARGPLAPTGPWTGPLLSGLGLALWAGILLQWRGASRRAAGDEP